MNSPLLLTTKTHKKSQENQSLQQPLFLVPYSPKLHTSPAQRPEIYINALFIETTLWKGPKVVTYECPPRGHR